MSNLLLITTILILPLLSSCQDLSLDGYKIFKIKTNKNSTQNISVSNDEKFALKFESNPTTGYDWHLTTNFTAYDKTLIEFLNLDPQGGGQYVSSSNGLIGGGGNTYFLLESGDNNGTVSLDFTYKRIWEGENPDNKEKRVDVTVGGSEE